ncbi:hypothetical protein BDV93DRAFT_517105 [Ceratobasidium sp. AG-I]|nr:hypothetical protein BDV93DRAFT_517105 [Ceratobasidium sp. AG-I]
MTSPQRPWSPHPPTHYQEPSTDQRGVENYLASQTQAQTQAPSSQSYYDPYAAQSMPWQPAPPQPQYAGARQMSLPMTSAYGTYAPNAQYAGHQQQATDASVEALDLAAYSAHLHNQQQYAQSQPQMYPSQPQQSTYYPQAPPYQYAAPQPAVASQPQFAPEQYHQTQHSQSQTPIRDFIDAGPFSYSGIRETSPPRVLSPPAQPRPAPRRQSIDHSRSPPPPQSPRGHLPWATESEHDLGEPDPVFPPHRNDSNSFPFNVQSAAAESNAHTTTSEAATPEGGANANPHKSYFSPDPEAHQPKNDWGVHQGGSRPGDIGADGKLISNGPRLRMAVRALEAVAPIGACVACIYAFAVPKPSPAAPPASKPAVYVIVVLGFLTLLAMGYIYIIRGLCGVGRKDSDQKSHTMVLPISRHRAGGKKDKKHGKGNSSVQVNLIVDPSMFSPKQESNLTPGVPWSEQQSANSGGVFTSFERLWWALGLDVLGAVVWGVAFVLAMIGPRCPAGGYSGWCNAYNGAVACACIGCVLFLVSAVLVGRDLVSSRRSERKLGGR